MAHHLFLYPYSLAAIHLLLFFHPQHFKSTQKRYLYCIDRLEIPQTNIKERKFISVFSGSDWILVRERRERRLSCCGVVFEERLMGGKRKAEDE